MLNGESLSVEELQDEIERLRQILERKLQVDVHQNYMPPASFQDKWKRHRKLLKKYVGKRVKITIAGPYYGKVATVTGPRGKQMEPVCWNLLLPDGKKVHKAGPVSRSLIPSLSK